MSKDTTNAATEIPTTGEEVVPSPKQNDIVPTRKPRGFAAISPERRKEISSAGGRAAQAAGTAHRFTSDEAKAAGTKGGNAPHVSRGTQKKPG